MGADLLSSGIAAGLGIFSAVGKGLKAHKLNKLADKVVVPDANYEQSPYAANILGEALRLKNAPMPGMAAATQNIYGNRANTAAGIERNATSGSQSLNMLAAAQGNTDQAFQGLAGQQNQYGLSMLNNYNNANQGMTDELDKTFQDKVRKQQLKINEKNGLRQAATNYSSGAFDSLTAGLTSGASIYNASKKG